MIKKKVFYVSVNGSDTPLTLEMSDILNKDEVLLMIAQELQTTQEFIKVISRRDNILSVFSVTDYFASIDDPFSETSFTTSLETVQQNIQKISILNLFLLWLTYYPQTQVEVDQTPTNEIIEKYDLHIANVMDELKDWKDQFDQEKQIITEMYRKLQDRLDALIEDECASNQIMPFVIRKIRISVLVPHRQSLYYYFDTVKLSQTWVIAFYKDLVRINNFQNISIEGFQNAIEDRNKDILTIFHNDLEQYITLGHSENNVNMFELSLDIRPFEDIQLIRQQVETILNIETEDTYKTTSVSGTLYIKNTSFEKVVWQDYVMNDVVAQKYLYVNEIDKATRFGENVTIHFEDIITAILVNSKTDTSPKPPAMTYFRGDYIRVNITKASGSQNDLDNIIRFQNIFCSIVQRFQSFYQDYKALYTELFPAFPLPVIGQLRVEEEEDLDEKNFGDKYKNIFKKTGYKTSCRPKSRVPKIVSKEEAKDINPLKIIRYPKDGDDTFGIPQEYLTCDDPEYAFPGITSMAGGTLFLPCCFNKNPRSSRAFLEYYKGEKISQPKGTEHIKSEYQIIKTFGDIGKLPSTIQQFLLVLMPEKTFYRVGTEDTPTTILHALNFLKGGERKSDYELRQELVNYFGKNLFVCKQENPSLSIDDIQLNLMDETLYLDPRKYSRLLEIYFNVNIILIFKSKKTETLELLLPDYENFYLRYEFDRSRPFVFLYEHWGTSPDRYTKRLHPVCEMIVADGFRRFELDTSTIQQMNDLFRIVFGLSPLIQNCPLVSPTMNYRKQIIDSWGKCRGIICEFVNKNKFVYMESVEPLPPLYISEEDTVVIRSISIPTMEYLQSEFKDMVITKYVTFRDTRYIQFRYGAHEWKTQIRSVPTDVEFSVIRNPFLSYRPEVEEIRISTVSKDKQHARILLDYVLYLYSMYAMDSLDFDNFFLTHTRVDTMFQFPKKISEIVNQNPLVMSQGVLTIPSDTIRKKLQFNIQYHLLYRYENLKQYRYIKFLPNFWECPYDFTDWKRVYYIQVFERLLTRPEYGRVERCDMSKLRGERGYWYMELQTPYYERRQPYLYEKITSQEQAIAVSLFWNKYGQLPVIDVQIPENSPLYNVCTWDEENGQWMPMYEDDKLNIFIGQSDVNTMYVFLEIKN